MSSFWTQSFKLTGANAGDNLGTRVSINRSGNIAILGAPLATVNGLNGAGYAYIFTGSGINWARAAKITGNDITTNDNFGNSVAFNSFGNVGIVGAYGADINGLGNVGAAYIFTGSGANWIQTAKITGSSGAVGDRFGYSVSLNSSGNVAIVGAYQKTINAVTNVGAAYIFTGSKNNWVETARLTGNGAFINDSFSSAVSLNDLGNVAVIGAYQENSNAQTDAGAAYIFTGSGSNWVRTARITGNDTAAYDKFGNSVSINSAGDIVVIGALNEDSYGLTDNGAAYIFTGSASNWVQTKKISYGTGQLNETFGNSVSINSLGDIVAIGAFGATIKDSAYAGAAYIFSGTGSNWSQLVKISAPLDASALDYFATSVAINGSGDIVLVGAYLEDSNNLSNAGAGYIYTDIKTNPIGFSREPCNFPGEDLVNENFNFTLEGELNPDYNTKHKVIIYKSGSNTGYLPIHETEYSGYSSNIITFNLQLDSGNYLSKVKSIYQENQSYTSFCNNGIQVLNLIDISRSNQSGFQVIKTSAELFFEEFLKENVKNKISNVYFSNNKYGITGFDFTNSTGVLRNSFTGIQIVNSTIEGSAILEAVSYINRVSWETSPFNTIQIVNIITNSVPYIVADRVGDSNQDIRNVYFSPPFEIKYRDLENNIYNNIYNLNKNVNFIYFDKNLNVNLDPKNTILDENQIRLFYKNLAFKLNGSFSHNEISPMIRSINNARDIQKQRVNCV
jgi:hypothetical protein